ncbi:hypothetical protein [Absidia glauca]|uniref:SGNH hydrolase-type esterase domain-containing protein n=1 Tax=Absidia glauca TaxID=4829 RepID=A0A163J1U0_ABSGL|nr:hypothetical protein [Absidia glauca]
MECELILFFDHGRTPLLSFDPTHFGLGASLANVSYNTDEVLVVLRQLLPTVNDQRTQAARIELMTIFFGANDASNSTKAVPLDRFQSNLVAMIKMIRDLTSVYYNPTLRLLLITPPPLNETL